MGRGVGFKRTPKPTMYPPLAPVDLSTVLFLLQYGTYFKHSNGLSVAFSSFFILLPFSIYINPIGSHLNCT